MAGIASDRREAGKYANERFQTALAAWRKRRRKAFAIVGAACVGPMVIAYFAAPKPWSSIALFLAGAFFGMLAFAWDSPPDFIENWRRGAEGERRTAKALRGLRKRGWTITHDLPARFGNHDHVAVGPGGVFLLDTKNIVGEACIEDELLTVRRPEDERATYQLPKLPRAMGGAAAELHGALRRHVSVPGLWVTAVVVVWPALEGGVVEQDRVTYVSGDRVSEWLDAQSPRLSAEQTQVISAAVRALRSYRPEIARAAAT